MINYQINDPNPDLTQCPSIDSHCQADMGAQVTIGDLHANALKLLYVLKRHGFIEIDPNDYHLFYQIYIKPVDAVTQSDIELFHQILNCIQVNNTQATLRLIGDEVCDRGSNDYFILKILEKLHIANVNMEILISNHSSDFIKAYEKKNDFSPSILTGEHANSMINMQRWIDNGLITRQDVLNLIHHSYKPHLRAVAATQDPVNQRLTVYTHAGTDLNTIKALAKRLGVAPCFSDDDMNQLSQMILAINHKFMTDYVNQNTVSALLYKPYELRGYAGYYLDPESAPLEIIIWNRQYDGLCRSPRCDFVHGHDDSEPSHGNVFNIDNIFGKAECAFNNTGEPNFGVTYNSLYSHQQPLSYTPPCDTPPVTRTVTFRFKDRLFASRQVSVKSNREQGIEKRQEQRRDTALNANRPDFSPRS